MSLPTFISIERLASGVSIWRKGGDFGPFGGAAEVVSCDYDHDGHYAVTARFIESDGSVEWTGDEEVIFHVDAGEKIEFAGQGIPPFMRPEGDVSDDEWEAKIRADLARFGEAMEALGVIPGQLRNIADALDGVPAMAAE
jgi:hypothetical protein